MCVRLDSSHNSALARVRRLDLCASRHTTTLSGVRGHNARLLDFVRWTNVREKACFAHDPAPPSIGRGVGIFDVEYILN